MRELLGRILSYAVFGIAAYGAIAFSWPVPEVPQPVGFSHAKHVNLNIDCQACHTGVLEGAQARLPSTKACALCHRADGGFPKTPGDLAGFIAEQEEIPWNQAQKMPDHVYFSHRRHVKNAKLGCESCHGDVAAAAQSITRAYLQTGEAGMTECINCHRQRNASTDCLACHR